MLSSRFQTSRWFDRPDDRWVELVAAGFFLLLVLAWVVVCLPAANRAREQSPLLSTRLFKRGLDLIGSNGHHRFVREFGSPPLASASLTSLPGVRSRSAGVSFRLVPIFLLCGLVLGVLLTGGLALFEGGSMWEIHLATIGALAIFVSLLIEEKHRKLERKRKVRVLKARHLARAEETGALRLVAGAE